MHNKTTAVSVCVLIFQEREIGLQTTRVAILKTFIWWTILKMTLNGLYPSFKIKSNITFFCFLLSHSLSESWHTLSTHIKVVLKKAKIKHFAAFQSQPHLRQHPHKLHFIKKISKGKHKFHSSDLHGNPWLPLDVDWCSRVMARWWHDKHRRSQLDAGRRGERGTGGGCQGVRE